ncbi:MAG TPA: PIN domain-containing protein [Syntrophales bacterium]|jgi:tRNA(fMet)-specific endonuclease VapC|nr:PIN domain-containing protein [Syntrophales bacterium]HON22926.1 PIN domain-containing protein [Syntrophales bacterium]HOU77498.1 PIN domain-containing protein [Syntrophales bacterium]HPC31922.1 PIN domain-containing protein [Syntrophales bacterium]HQG35381.1 PIN domain-containing protein [Syntrophales bacterium]
MYLLDTDTVIYLLKGQPAVVENLKNHLAEPIKISVTTYMELQYGAYKSQRAAANLAKIKSLGQSIDLVTITMADAEIFGLLKADLEKAGIRLDDFDLAIAACALANNLTLVTNNNQHFERIEGLKLENWADP